MKKLSKKKRAKIVARAMREVWASLDSHLDWAAKSKLPKPESAKFHALCVQEYARTLVLISKLY